MKTGLFGDRKRPSEELRLTLEDLNWKLRSLDLEFFEKDPDFFILIIITSLKIKVVFVLRLKSMTRINLPIGFSEIETQYNTYRSFYFGIGSCFAK